MNGTFKTLFKLTRKQLFRKEYFCTYCDMIDFDKEWMWKHVKNIHDESGNLIRFFVCKNCNIKIIENDIINHISKHTKYTCNVKFENSPIK